MTEIDLKEFVVTHDPDKMTITVIPNDEPYFTLADLEKEMIIAFPDVFNNEECGIIRTGFKQAVANLIKKGADGG